MTFSDLLDAIPEVAVSSSLFDRELEWRENGEVVGVGIRCGLAELLEEIAGDHGAQYCDCCGELAFGCSEYSLAWFCPSCCERSLKCQTTL